MERFETEEQQIEAIKGFWKENGTVIILGAVLGLGGLFGWRYYNDSMISAKESASMSYQESVELFVENEDASALAKLSAEDDSTYASLAALIVAQKAVQDEDYESAKAQLKISASKDDEIADIAKMRLAKVHLQLGELDDALVQLNAVGSDAFADQVSELKGDVYYAQGKFDDAQAAYNIALAELPNNQAIKMKLDNIAYAKTQGTGSN